MITNYLPSFLGIGTLMMVALVSPGPDFAIVVKNSLLYSRKKALLTALGIACGILFHVTYVLLGFGLIISKNIILFSIFKYAGAAYLIYIGIKSLKAKKQKFDFGEIKNSKEISALFAFNSGLLTNILNPKAMLFFVSLFSSLIDPKAPAVVLFIYAVIIFSTTLGWFIFVAFCLSSKKSQKYFQRFAHFIERLTGGILIALGTKLIFIKGN